MLKLIKKFIGVGVLLSSVYLFLFLYLRDKVFVLVYHQIGDYKGGLKSLYVRPEVFESQMEFLFKRGYKTISLEELRKQVENKRIIPKNFCITFDDGYKNNFEYAYPVLKKYNFKATVFVTTDAIGRDYSYPYMPAARHLSEEDIKKIRDIFEIGSHSVSHKNMAEVSEEEIINEIKFSKKKLESIAGDKVKHFCYPFGRNFEGYNILLSSYGYLTACSLKKGFVDENTDIYLIPRFEWKDISAMSVKDFFKNFSFYVKIVLGV